MGKRENEKAIFDAFLKIEPMFAGDAIIEWTQPADEKEFPDVICRSTSGKRIGVELGEWLHESEMQFAKSMERLQESILAAVGDQGSNNTENIFLVWLHPKPKARIRPADEAEFRRQLFECLQGADRQWPSERFWHSRQGHCLTGRELEPYPIVAKYLSGIQLFPREAYEGWPPQGRKIKRRWSAGVDWITFPARGGPFSNDTMVQPLLQLLADKKQHYSSAGTGFDHLCLVVYYNQAILYNSPVETPRFGFDEVVSAAARFIDGDPDPFHSVYLFLAVDSGRVLRVC